MRPSQRLTAPAVLNVCTVVSLVLNFKGRISHTFHLR